MARPIPDELLAALRAARRVETTVDLPRQRARGYAATNRLLAAVHAAGWAYAEIAPVMGISAAAVRQRAVRTGPAAGIEIPSPPEPEPAKHAVDRTVWLTSAEASAVASVSVATLALWRQAGLLPRTQPRSKTFFWYHVGDLQRIVAAPRYRRGGVDRSAVLAMIIDDAA